MKLSAAFLFASLALTAATHADELINATSFTVSSLRTPSTAEAAPVQVTASHPTIVELSVNVETIRRAVLRLTLEKSGSRSGSESHGTWYASAGRLVSLVSDGVTVRHSAGSRTALLVGREFAVASSAAPNIWTVKLATTW